MTPERYRQINALADAALHMRPEQRSGFLDGACGSDAELRKQIEALLDAESYSGDFLEKPLLEVLAGDSSQTPPHRDLAGSRIANYEVLSRLGAGGIGEVWLARDANLNREIALKLLSPRLSGDPYHMRRFQQEARAASALNHPNIVTVYEIGESDCLLYIAEERVSGETIRQRLAHGRLPFQETLEIASQAAAALDAAHSAGVIHRDIKPENVMVRPDGLVKLLDFGLARFVERPADADGGSSAVLSVPGFILGTVRYMSPEQARGLSVDGRSDLFSLGVLLYEMAAGIPPFSGATPTDTLAAILADQPAPLSGNAPDVPAEFERIVRRCLAKDPAARYDSASALKDDLTRLATQLRQPSAPPRRWRIVAAACAALAAIAVAYFLAGRKPPETAFNSMRITRLPTRGDAADTAISHDGKLLAYVADESAGQSLWVRDSSGSNESAVVPVEAGEHSGVTFSPDDAFLYYRRKRAADIGDLYRVPVKGGVPQRIIGEVSGAVAPSPDGRRIAFVRLRPATREASLVMSNADGSGESTLATLQRPRYFDQHSVAWSPDGRSIACFAGEAASYSAAVFHLVEVSLADGSQRAITSQSWAWPRSVAWAAKGDVLIVTAASRGNDIYQLWMVRPGNGQVTRLTNDLSNYDRVTITNDGRSLATVQSESAAAIWVAAGGDASRAVRISGPPIRSPHISVAWTPSGRVVYSDPTGDSRNLWLIDSDGTNRRHLTSGMGDLDQMVMTYDGRYIVYKQDGNIWRADADGSHPRQLTHGPLDVHPDVTEDGHSVVYASFAGWSPAVGGQPALWKAPIDGGQPVEISAQPASYPKVSPDGERLGCIYYPAGDPRFSAAHVGILRMDGTGGFSVLNTAPSDETELSWSPDGKALDYTANVGGVGNIWRQPADGGPAVRVTRFASDELYAFAWSRDGNLVCARGATTHGVVLIQNFR